MRGSGFVRLVTVVSLAAACVAATACTSIERGGPPVEERVLRFDSPAALAEWVVAGGEWRVADGHLVGHSLDPSGRVPAETATWRTFLGDVERVIVRGGLDAGSPNNFRVAVGPAAAIFNWECADANWFNFGRSETQTRPGAMSAGREHEVVFEQAGDRIRVVVDDKLLWEHLGHLSGTLVLHPCFGSTMRIREIVVRGRAVPWVDVKGPSSSIL